MLIPGKHENINRNILVEGAKIIGQLKGSRDGENIEEFYQKLKREENLSLKQYMDVLTFLWLGNIIEVKLYRVRLK